MLKMLDEKVKKQFGSWTALTSVEEIIKSLDSEPMEKMTKTEKLQPPYNCPSKSDGKECAYPDCSCEWQL